MLIRRKKDKLKLVKQLELEAQVMKEGSETWNSNIASITSQTW